MRHLKLALVIAIAAGTILFGLSTAGLLNLQCQDGCQALSQYASHPLLIGISILVCGLLLWQWKASAKSFDLIARCSGGGALLLIGLMAVLKTRCDWCLTLDCLYLALAFSTLRPWFAGPGLLMFGGLALFGFLPMAVRQSKPLVIHTQKFRTYEATPRADGSHVLVFYTDPSCPHCRTMHAALRKGNLREATVLYRWRLVTNSAENSLRAAAVAETLLESDPAKGRDYIHAMFEAKGELTDEVLTKIGKKLGCEPVVRKALEAPEKDVLRRIAEDGLEADQLRIDSVPAVYIVRALPSGPILNRLSPEDIDNMAKAW